MAIVITAEVEGQTDEGYRGMLTALEGALKQAPGFILHSAYLTPQGERRVIEMWQSAKEANRFFADFIHPNLPPGVKVKRTLHELHSLVTVGLRVSTM